MLGLGWGQPRPWELVGILRPREEEAPDGRNEGVHPGFSSLAPGFSHLPSGLYPSYLHLNHLEPPSSGSPLLSQLGQPSIFDTQKGQEA